MYQVAKTLAENRPGFIIWAMGQTQHTNANADRARDATS